MQSRKGTMLNCIPALVGQGLDRCLLIKQDGIPKHFKTINFFLISFHLLGRDDFTQSDGYCRSLSLRKNRGSISQRLDVIKAMKIYH